MRRSILVILAMLVTLSATAQKKVVLSIEQEVGAGLAKGPVCFSTTEFVAALPMGEVFSVGVGAGLRFGLPTHTYSIVHEAGQKDKTRRTPCMELDIPVFLRLGCTFSIVIAQVDLGYAPGVLAMTRPGAIPGGKLDPCYSGFFVEPHVGLSLGAHSAVGMGILFQQGKYMNKESVITDTDMTVTTKTLSSFTSALTLRYAYRF